jgi:hypothetical protein
VRRLRGDEELAGGGSERDELCLQRGIHTGRKRSLDI